MPTEGLRARRYVYGGLLAAVGVAVALALVFTVGGAGQKDKAAVASEPNVASLDTDVNIKDVFDAAKPAETAPIKVDTWTPPKASEPEESASTGQTFTNANANALTGAIKGDPLQAIATMGADVNLKDFVGQNSCWPADGAELLDAVENQGCELVVLSSGDPDAYALDEDIKVNRYVRVMGNPAVLPQIDAEDAERAFTVGPGGLLELQFVRVRQGGGTVRDRYGLEGSGSSSVVGEIRGGCVSVEPGALGANFVGVTFIAVANDWDSVQGAIEDQIDFVGGRIYGGHVYVAAGTVNFFGCNFWDTTLLLPFTDQVSIGGDVLVVAGNAFFTGCTFTATLLFGNFGGAGFNVAVLGGNAVFTFCVIQAQGVAQSANGAGQILFVGGGTMILTGLDFRFAAPILFFSGIGDFFVGGGVMIFTGVTIENTYPILAAYGAGFYLAVGGGVMVETGVTYVQFNCPAHQGLTGASIFTGAGVSIHVGVPASFYGTTVLFTGQGGFSYNGAGYSLWLGSPIAIFLATFAFFGLGGLTSQPAGFMVYLGCPAFLPAALVYFAGLGAVMYLGAGGAVIGGSPVFAPAFKFYSSPEGVANYYVQGNGDAPNNGIGYYDKNTSIIATPVPKIKPNKTRILATEEDFHNEVRKLRAERRLSVSAVSDLLFNFMDADGGVSFLGADLKVQPYIDLGNNEVVKELSSWVPAGILQGAKDIGLLNKFGSEVGRGPLLEMQADSVTECQFCGEGDVVGSNKGACTKFDSCNALKEKAPAGSEAAFDSNEVEYDAWHVVMATFNPTTPAGESVAPEDFRDAFRSYFLANKTTGVSVSAFLDQPDELFKESIPARALSALADDKFPASTPLRAVFLFNDDGKAEAVASALQDTTSSWYEDMELYVQDFLSLDGVQIGAMDGELEKVLYVPAYNTPEWSKAFAKEADAAAGTNSIRLIDGEHAGLPMSHVAAGQTYTVLLSKFPKNLDMTVQLIGSQEQNGKSKQTMSPISSIKTDKDGSASITWKVPADQPLGDYYLKANDKTGLIFGMTPSLEVTAAPKRRLWGPHMEL